MIRSQIIVIVIMFIHISSTLDCMQSLTNKLRCTRFAATSLVGSRHQQFKTPGRSFIYRIKEVGEDAYGAYNSKAELIKASKLLSSQRETVPNIILEYNHFYFAVLKWYASDYTRSTGEHFFRFTQPQDMKQLIESAFPGDLMENSPCLNHDGIYTVKKHTFNNKDLFILNRHYRPSKALLSCIRAINWYCYKGPYVFANTVDDKDIDHVPDE